MDSSTLSTIAPLFLIMAIMYFLLIRPQQQQAKKLREKIGGVQRGDTVITAGGHIATVSKPVKPEDEHVTVEIADGVHTRVLKTSLTDVRPRGGDAAADKG